MLSAEKNRILTQVGPGTPMGEYLRRYWQPIGGASQLDKDPIKAIRLMGEDLVLYKDLGGSFGLERNPMSQARRGVNARPDRRGKRDDQAGCSHDGKALAR